MVGLISGEKILSGKEQISHICKSYKNGKLNLSEAAIAIAENTGLTPEIVKCFLLAMNRSNITSMKSIEFSATN